MRKNRISPSSPWQPDYSAGYHYDQFEALLRFSLGPTMTYSCGYFEIGRETLEQAQIAKLDLAFRKIGLRAGHRLVDIGCGWGTAALRAVETCRATAIGLTLSRSQLEYARNKANGKAGLEYRLQGWETFTEPCDRIICLGAFEHFGSDKYTAFFARCRELLPPDGLILLQTITTGKPSQSFALYRFARLVKSFYHGGEITPLENVISHSRIAGFELLQAESLRAHYPLTLDAWVGNLEKNKDAAIRLTNPEVYGKFKYYLETSAKYFRSGESNVYQLLFRVI